MEEDSILTKTRRIGGSLVVTIPAKIVELEQLEENQLVELRIKKRRKDYFGALRGIGSFTEEDKAKGQFEK